MPVAGNVRTFVSLARHVDIATDAIGFAGVEMADVFIAARELERAGPLHQPVPPFALVEQAGVVEIGAAPVETSVVDGPVIGGEDRGPVVGRLALDAPHQVAGAADPTR